jgi:hypothetical protein
VIITFPPRLSLEAGCEKIESKPTAVLTVLEVIARSAPAEMEGASSDSQGRAIGPRYSGISAGRLRRSAMKSNAAYDAGVRDAV